MRKIILSTAVAALGAILGWTYLSNSPETPVAQSLLATPSSEPQLSAAHPPRQRLAPPFKATTVSVLRRDSDVSMIEAGQNPAVTSLATEQNISIAEAARRLAWQARVPALENAAESKFGEKFAGVWIDGKDGDRVKLSLVNPSPGELEAAHKIVEAGKLADAVDVVSVSYGQRQLEAANEWLGEQIVAANANAANKLGTAIRPDRNVVRLNIPTTGPLTNEQQLLVNATLQRYGDMIEIARENSEGTDVSCMANLCDPPLRGGVIMYIQLSSISYQTQCSTGFNAIGAFDGASYMITAGHCVSGGNGQAFFTRTPTSGNNYLSIGTVKAFRFSSADDVAAISVDNPSFWNPMPWVRSVGPDLSVNNQYNIYDSVNSTYGSRVCVTGGLENATKCGRVNGVGISYVSEGVTRTGKNSVQACYFHGGDSGSPVFIDNFGHGIVLAVSTTSCLTYYQPLKKVESALAVRIRRLL